MLDAFVDEGDVGDAEEAEAGAALQLTEEERRAPAKSSLSSRDTGGAAAEGADFNFSLTGLQLPAEASATRRNKLEEEREEEREEDEDEDFSSDADSDDDDDNGEAVPPRHTYDDASELFGSMPVYDDASELSSVPLAGDTGEETSVADGARALRSLERALPEDSRLLDDARRRYDSGRWGRSTLAPADTRAAGDAAYSSFATRGVVATYDEPTWGRRAGVVTAIDHGESWEAEAKEDNVLMSAYAPRAVVRDAFFQLSVWLYCANQFADMHERATRDGATVRGRSTRSLRVRRGRIVTVLLELPAGVLETAAGGDKTELVWRGDVEHADFAVRCVADAPLGLHRCKATVVFGASVAEVRFHVNVAAARADAGADEGGLCQLDSELRILEHRYSEIAWSDVELREPVGSGFAGQTWLAEVKGGSAAGAVATLRRAGSDVVLSPAGGPTVVVKRLFETAPAAGADRLAAAMKHEAAVQAMVGHHPNVVAMVGACTEEANPALVLEYMPNGSLDDHLTREARGAKPLSDSDRLHAALDVSRGVMAVHDARALHRDIAPRNCLVGRDYTVKVADFGLAAALADTELLEIHGVQPLNIAAPECLSETPVFSTASDVYQFGCMLYTMWAREAPYAALDSAALAKRVGGGLVTLQAPAAMPKRVAAVMQGCTAVDAAARLSMSKAHAQLLAAV